MQQLDFFRWGILLKILPLTVLFGLAKWGIHLLKWEIWEFDSLIAALFAAATFVIAFILGGTLSDYHASQDMVNQITSTVASIQDTALLTAANHAGYDPKPLSMSLVQVLQRILDWLKQNQSVETVKLALDQLNPHFAELEKFTSGPIVSRVQGEQAKLRLVVARMQLIRDTEFLAPAYVLLQLFLVGAIGALLFISSAQLSKALFISSFLFTAFIYLVALIRDLDNPFQYDGKSCVDVDLAPLDQTISSLQTGLQAKLPQSGCIENG
jgi:hypothetical protein